MCIKYIYRSCKIHQKEKNTIKNLPKHLNRYLTKEDIQVINKHIKISNTIYHQEIQINTMKCHYTSIKNVKFKKLKTMTILITNRDVE